MSATNLIQALRTLADELYRLRDAAQGDGPTPKHLDHAGLSLEVLAHIVSGKTIERAFGAPGDWGYGTPIGKGLLAMLRAPRAADGSGIKWHFAPELPDDETRVMFAAGDDVEVGYHADGRWMTDSETTFDESDVYAWAHLPEPPELPVKKGGAS